MSITVDKLKSFLSYDPSSGLFTWLVSRGKAKKGSIAGHTEHTGYVSIGIEGKYYVAHRLAWLYVFGSFPDLDLDHIDGDKENNRIGNLRLATKHQNRQNLSEKGMGSNPRMGVNFDKDSKKWRARIMFDGKRHCLGSFNSFEEAGKAYDEKKKELHKFCPELRKV
jgi:hypothetical protein